MIEVQLRERDRLVMASAAAAVLPDSCVILRYTEGAADSHGFPTQDWVADAAPTPCAFTPGGGPRERDDQASETLLGAGRVRLATGVALDHRDRLLLVARFGQVLTTEPHTRTYELVEAPLVTSAGLHAAVRLLTNARKEPGA